MLDYFQGFMYKNKRNADDDLFELSNTFISKRGFGNNLLNIEIETMKDLFAKSGNKFHEFNNLELRKAIKAAGELGAIYDVFSNTDTHSIVR